MRIPTECGKPIYLKAARYELEQRRIRRQFLDLMRMFPSLACASQSSKLPFRHASRFGLLKRGRRRRESNDEAALGPKVEPLRGQ
jgi:hypothetical protein